MKRNEMPSAVLRDSRHTCIRHGYEAEIVKSRANRVTLSPTPDSGQPDYRCALMDSQTQCNIVLADL